MEIRNAAITFIGTGRLAHSVVPYLQKNKFNLVEILGSTDHEAKEFASVNNIKSSRKFNGSLSKESRVIFLAINDQAIEPAAVKIASANRNLKGKIFIHFSGSLGSGILHSLKKKGASTASFHIMQTFPSEKKVNLVNCYCGIETDDEALLFSLFNFAKQMKLRPFRIASESKPFYHLAGVFASNFLSSHIYNSLKAFKLSGIEAVSFYDLFGNIIDQTLRNIKEGDLRKAVSGPVVRNDLNTIKAHIDVLKKRKEWLLLAGYLVESITLTELLSDGTEDYIKLKKYLIPTLKAVSKKIPS